MLGTGMMLLSIEDILSQVHYTRRKEIETILQTKTVTGHHTEDQFYVCPKCRNFCSRQYVRIDYEGGYYETTFKCSKCRTQMKEWHGRSFKRLKCSVCGGNKFEEGCQILWD